MDTFRCGHPKTAENSRWKRDTRYSVGGFYRCRTCDNSWKIQRARWWNKTQAGRAAQRRYDAKRDAWPKRKMDVMDNLSRHKLKKLRIRNEEIRAEAS